MAIDQELLEAYRKTAEEKTQALIERNEELAALREEKSKLEAELATLKARHHVQEQHYQGRRIEELSSTELVGLGHKLEQERRKATEAPPPPLPSNWSTLSPEEQMRLGRAGVQQARAVDKSGRAPR